MCFKMFERMHATSLYWFAAQQQASRFRWQNNGLFYLIFSVEFSELNLDFYKQQEVVK